MNQSDSCFDYLQNLKITIKFQMGLLCNNNINNIDNNIRNQRF